MFNIWCFFFRDRYFELSFFLKGYVLCEVIYGMKCLFVFFFRVLLFGCFLYLMGKSFMSFGEE